MKHKIIACLVLFFCFAFIVGCAAVDPTAPTSPSDIIPDVFQETTKASEETQVSTSVEANNTDDLGGLGIGAADEPLKDEYGTYRIYNGGEMCTPIEIESTGALRQAGTGILLFIDGQPQPYRLENEDSYSYFHCFYPKRTREIYNLYFTPITGSAGDTLEVYILSLQKPEYLPSDGNPGMMIYTSGSIGAGWRLKFESTPPEADFPEKQVRLSDAEIAATDASFGDTVGWSEEDLRERLGSRSYVNEAPHNGQNRVYNITAGTPVDLRYELWGTPYIKSSVIFYVDNVPVFAQDEQPFDMAVASGEKKILTAKLDMTGFTGESVVYMVRVPRNYRTSEIRTYGFIQGEGTWFLLAGEEPAG